MTNLMHYEKGCSPSAIQRKYSLTYENGYELAERLKKTQELELELRKENTKLKELLKECREEIEKHIPKKWHGEKDETMQKYRNKRELRTKIDEVLK